MRPQAFPKLTIETRTEDTVLAIKTGGSVVETRIGPEAALAAGMWLLDLVMGRVATGIVIDGLNAAETIEVHPVEGCLGEVTLSIRDGVSEAIVALGPLQGMLASEHLMADGIGGGARPAALA